MSADFTKDVALLSLFQRNVSARPDAPALVDATGVSLSYSAVSNAVAHLAQQIDGLGLPPESSIALLLPSGNELTLALLAVMQSGHIAVPMPVAWRKSDLVRACREAEAGALIATANFAPENLPELAAEVAIEVFELSFPLAFGTPLPDGIMPLAISSEPAETQSGAGTSKGIATMQPAREGISFVLHSNEEMLAAGLGAMLAADVQSEDAIISAVSLSNYAGLTAAFVPWLLSGGALTLLPEISKATLQNSEKRTHVIVPVGAAKAAVGLIGSPMASLAAVHFCGSAMGVDFDTIDTKQIVDVIALNEVCALALPRKDASNPQPLPLGPVHAGNSGAGSPVILETAIAEEGTVLVRGALVPASALDGQEWLDTGYLAIPADDTSFHIDRPVDLIAVGALRFSVSELERRIHAAAAVMHVDVVNDEVLGNRLVVMSENPEETMRALIDAGLPRVIANAVRKADNLSVRSA